MGHLSLAELTGLSLPQKGLLRLPHLYLPWLLEYQEKERINPLSFGKTQGAVAIEAFLRLGRRPRYNLPKYRHQ